MSDAIAKVMAALQASQPDIRLTEQPAVPKEPTARQEVEPDAPTRSTQEVTQDVTVVATDLRTALAALPDERRLAVPAERDEVWDKRRLLQSVLTRITSPLEGRLVKLDRRRAEAKHWYSTLTAARIDLEKSLEQVEAAGSKDFRLDQALRVSLRMIQNGDDSEEMFANPLMSWLHKNGIRPEPGARGYMTGRGGLVSVEANLAEIEKERDAIIRDIEATLVEAKTLLARITSATV